MEKCIATASAVFNEVRKVIVGKDDVILKALTAVLAGGHLLMEDIPGVGKTTLAMAFARSMSLDYNRIQFTPDVLPSDVTGFSIYNANSGNFEYKPGAVMCNLFLADEINRTSSKTQSALLEVMEEGVVTVDGISRSLEKPFVVIATQNPVGSIGTQRLPESQLDRFMIKVSMGYPKLADEVSILKGKNAKNMLDSINPVANKGDIKQIMDFVQSIYVDDKILEYIAGVVGETRVNPYIELGVSPRGSLAVLAMSKSNAFMHGRNYVIPNDVKEIFLDVTAHRVLLSSKGKLEKKDISDILWDIINDYPVPKI